MVSLTSNKHLKKKSFSLHFWKILLLVLEFYVHFDFFIHTNVACIQKIKLQIINTTMWILKDNRSEKYFTMDLKNVGLWNKNCRQDTFNLHKLDFTTEYKKRVNTKHGKLQRARFYESVSRRIYQKVTFWHD